MEKARVAMETRARWRTTVAAAIACVGFVAITPSFSFDTDNDGVVDSIEVYEMGTDPGSAEAFHSPIVAERKG